MLRKCVVVVALMFALTACGDNDREAIGSSDNDAANTEVDERQSEEAVEEPEETTSTTEAEPEAMDLTVEAGMTSGVNSIGTRYTTAGALVTNPNESLAAYNVTVVFNLVNASGSILDTDSSNVPYIPANTTVPVAPLQIGFDLAEEPAGVDVNVAGEFDDDTGWEGVEFSMEDGIELVISETAFASGQFGNTLSFAAMNPSDTVVEWASWHCVLKQGGAVIGGQASGISDPIVPEGSVRVDGSVSVDSATPDEVICRAYG